jgi:hypothetical protein
MLVTLSGAAAQRLPGATISSDLRAATALETQAVAALEQARALEALPQEPQVATIVPSLGQIAVTSCTDDAVVRDCLRRGPGSFRPSVDPSSAP